MKNKLKTTLFVPVLDEITGVKIIMPRINKEWVDEIVVVDGGSTDGTIAYFEENGYHVIQQRSPGLSQAYWECLEVAKGDIIIPFSPDNNSIPELIPKLVEKMTEGYDMVIVSRYANGAKSEDDDLITGFGNWMFTRMTNFLFRAQYTDALVMFRAFRKDLIERLEIPKVNTPVFEILLDIRCAKQKMNVADIPGNEPIRIGGKRKMQILYNGFSILYQIIKERIRSTPVRKSKAEVLESTID